MNSSVMPSEQSFEVVFLDTEVPIIENFFYKWLNEVTITGPERQRLEFPEAGFLYKVLDRFGYEYRHEFGRPEIRILFYECIPRQFTDYATDDGGGTENCFLGP